MVVFNKNIANYYPHLKSGFSKRALHVKMAEMQFYQLYLKTLTPTIQSVWLIIYIELHEPHKLVSKSGRQNGSFKAANMKLDISSYSELKSQKNVAQIK